MSNKSSPLKNISKDQEKFLKKYKARKRNIFITQLLILLAFILIWEASARLNLIDTFLTSSPSAIYKLFIDFLKDGSIFKHVGISVMETVVGFVVGTILGLIIAIILWWSDFLAKVLDPYLVILNSLPKTALAPIIIIWVGAGYSGIIVTAITLSIVITIMNIYTSFKEINEESIKMLETFGATKFQILRKLVLPASVPSIISTIKVNIGLSWVGVIVGEFLVSRAGIGYLIVYGGQVFKLDLVMMSVIILAVLTALMYKCISIVENKFMKWRQ
ncbi:ABC-type nitrate/sulfonate/bicarbonate transport system, permease component [Gottschalkia purinilytica]|uniref:ABC-type nitrate/sulfonate/bicarbonate transport system, permease component n=1 Tax=Gottschalkia purinilytica TaxID=1503 RepID=A0A0L0W9N9_GOTPU|nr:ABC transporter permease [Gottschalkia purinilytica]KNF08162.1 ABC-type nitrate/sulfonate/bicarbonate transport system, permease component [Gottschalkia purinilytica]